MIQDEGRQLICFDTCVAIWAIQSVNNIQNTDFVARSKKLLVECKKQKHKIMLPSVVLGEMMCSIPVNEQNDFRKAVSDNFIVVPYDALAAQIFSGLWKSNKSLRKETNFTRQEMKADFMIVATAIAKRASCIYTTDNGISKFAGDRIEVKEPPSFSQQLKLIS